MLGSFLAGSATVSPQFFHNEFFGAFLQISPLISPFVTFFLDQVPEDAFII